MKKITLTLFLLIPILTIGQNAPIDFETGGFGDSWTWTVFENDTDPPLEIVANPDASGINTSSTVAKFTAMENGNPWAGCESLHGADIGGFTFDATNTTVKIMVYKSVISDVGIKFAEVNGEAQPEVKVANTLINQWEELTFDLSGSIGTGITGINDQIIIFPDFAPRTQDNIIYFDNVTFSEQGEEEEEDVPMVAAPTPTIDAADVISIFNTNNPYTDITNVEYNPFWGQGTQATQVEIDGNNTLKYTNLNYQGTDFSGNNQNVNGMNYLHIDYWTSNATELKFYIINATTAAAGEKFFDFDAEDGIITNQWVSKDIPLTHFTDQGFSLDDVMQFKVVGNGTLFLDNIYFSTVTLSVNDNEISETKVYPNPSSNIWTIQSASNPIIGLQLYNVLGKQVLDIKPNSTQVQLQAEAYSKGIYFAHVKTEQSNTIIKLVRD